MVQTPRTGAPAELVRHSGRWTARFVAIRAGSRRAEWATPGAKKVLAAALHGLAHGKCAYCESALGVSSYLAIEHHVAKTIAPSRSFEWANLLPACERCNTAKGEEDHQGALLKPDDEDPEPYFWIHPDTGKLEPHPKLDDAGKRRAMETIRLCDLQRGALCAKRVDMLIRVGRWLTSGAFDHDEWQRLSHPVTEYKFVLRHVLETRGLPDLAKYDRTRFLSVAL